MERTQALSVRKVACLFQESTGRRRRAAPTMESHGNEEATASRGRPACTARWAFTHPRGAHAGTVPQFGSQIAFPTTVPRR